MSRRRRQSTTAAGLIADLIGWLLVTVLPRLIVLWWRHRRITFPLTLAAGLWYWLDSIRYTLPWALPLWALPLTAWVLIEALAVAVHILWTRRRAIRAGVTDRPLRTWKQARARAQAVARQWEHALTNHGLASRSGTVPNLYNLRPTATGDVTGSIRSGRVHVPVSKFVAEADGLAESFGCREVRVTPTAQGCADLTFLWSDPLGRLLPIAELPESPPGTITYGVRSDGSPATFAQGLSLFIGGSTSSGKSSLTWALLADLIRKGVPVRLYVSDPAGGVELDALSKHVREVFGDGMFEVREYADDTTKTLEMIEHCARGMDIRMKYQTSRKHTPTVKDPLVILLLDETLTLTEMLKKGAQGPLGRIAFSGRKAGYCVWMSSQLGQVKAVGDTVQLIPQRACLRTVDRFTTEAVLGQGAEQRGAKCSELRYITDAGLGWSVDEAGRLMKFRAAYVSDETDDEGLSDIQRVAQGIAPRGMVATQETRKTAVYRFYGWPDESGGQALLYVGITVDPEARFGQHADSQPWWHEVDQAATLISWFPSRAAALAEEERIIKAELPRENKTHNGRNPTATVNRRRRR